MSYKKPDYYNFELNDANPDHRDFSAIFGDAVSRNCPIMTGNPLGILPELKVKRDGGSSA